MRRMIRFALFGVVLLALLSGASIGQDRGLAAQGSPSQLVIAVARFDDRSNSGLANVGEGVADLLTERLVNAGYRVVERAEIESVLLERGLNPLLTTDLATAAQLVGADVLLIGSVTRVDIRETTISLGFLTVSGATVTVGLSIRAVSVYTTEIMDATSVEAQAEGETGCSLNIGQLISTLTGWRANVCTGGFLADKGSYVQGEIVNFGYRDPVPPHTYRVIVKDSLATTVWVSSWKGSAPASPCVTWSWDQRDLWWNPVPPGNYTAELELWPGGGPPVAARPFTITVGAPPPWLSEI
ncbi:MAG: CsgG/HfaB family protein, partial [Candidatus Bipolaricaulia bacterium]